MTGGRTMLLTILWVLLAWLEYPIYQLLRFQHLIFSRKVIIDGWQKFSNYTQVSKYN